MPFTYFPFLNNTMTGPSWFVTWVRKEASVLMRLPATTLLANSFSAASSLLRDSSERGFVNGSTVAGSFSVWASMASFLDLSEVQLIGEAFTYLLALGLSTVVANMRPYCCPITPKLILFAAWLKFICLLIDWKHV